MSSHVERGQWPVLLSSVESDADRRAAEHHALACPECDTERTRAERFLSSISAELAMLPPREAPSPKALERAKKLVVRELVSPWRAPQPARWKALLGVLAFGLLVAMSRQRALDVGSLLVSATLLALALAGLAGNRWPGMLWGLPLVLCLPVGLLTETIDFKIGHGLSCSLAELFAAALPVGALWLVVRRGSYALPSDFARAAIGGALAGQAALVLTCPSHSLGHLLLFHSAVVIAAGLMGAVVGQLAKPASA